MSLKKIISLDSPLRIFYHYLRWVLAFLVYWNPAKKMIVIWVTWTKWKTTTTNIIHKWLCNNWEKVFMFSTVNYWIWEDILDNNFKMTSPSPFLLQKLLKKAKVAWCKYAVIETSSHSIFYNRNFGIDYDVVVLTNISQDHLDLHGNMDNYVKTKLKIFENLVKYNRKEWVKKVSVVNIDSPYSSDFLNITDDNKYTYWLNSNASIQAQNIVYEKEETELDIKIPWDIFKIKTKLKWDFNVYNILAAVCVLISQKVPKDKIITTINSIWWIPWRLDEVPNDRQLKIYVDYAHTEESLKNVLQTLKEIKGEKWRLITVFGATWDRDKDKRPKMWKIADELSDFIILTDDDTYTENSLSIINDVARWIKRKEWEKFWIVPSREDAIRTALSISEAWDFLIVAGKWAETMQVTNKWPIPWNDKKIISAILREMDDNDFTD